jgi:hypothetical protein
LGSDKDNEHSQETMLTMIEAAATRHETYQLRLAMREFGPASRAGGLTDKQIVRHHLIACRRAIDHLESIVGEMKEEEVREKVLNG